MTSGGSSGLPESRPPELRSLVLAGGASTRMGTDKALLTYGEEPQARRLSRLLETVAAPVSVSVRAAQLSLPELAGMHLLPGP